MTGRRRSGGDLLLTLGAIVGAVVLVLLAAGVAWQARPVAVRSGSMSPTLPVGSVAVVRRVPVSRLQVGDVVTVTSGDHLVTHRIVQLTRHGERVTLQLRGDANPAPDPDLYDVTSAERVVASVPWIGYVLAGLTGPAGWFLGAVYAFWLGRRLVSGAEDPLSPGRHRSRRRPARGTRRGPRRRPGRGLVVGTVASTLAVGATLGLGASRASAAWADSVPFVGPSLTTTTIPRPATFTCGGLGILSVTFTWSAVAGATSYDLHYGSGGSQVVTVTGTSYTVVSALSGGTAWVQANVNYGSTTWRSIASTSRSYTVALVSLCS